MPFTIHHRSRKIFLGALALALPLTSVAFLESPALAKAPASLGPITCTNVSGTVTFASPGLTLNGAHMPSKTSLTTIASIALTCPGVSASGPTGLTIKNKSLVADPKVKGQHATWTYDTFFQFFTSAPAIAKYVKKLNFTINGFPEQFKTASVTPDAGAECPGEVGFVLGGAVKKTPYNTSNAEVLACLGTDTGTNISGSFGADVGNPAAGPITTAQIDPAESEAIL